jgi:hypothetical protein
LVRPEWAKRALEKLDTMFFLINEAFLNDP